MKDKVYIGKHCFTTLVAVSEEEHRKGLMGKQWPPPIMAFPYKKAEIRKFWMKNTPSPLDILFIRSGHIIDICQGHPHSLSTVGPDEPSDLVVELPAGSAKDFGISIGDDVTLYYSINTAMKKMQNQFW